MGADFKFLGLPPFDWDDFNFLPNLRFLPNGLDELIFIVESALK